MCNMFLLFIANTFRILVFISNSSRGRLSINSRSTDSSNICSCAIGARLGNQRIGPFFSCNVLFVVNRILKVQASHIFSLKHNLLRMALNRYALTEEVLPHESAMFRSAPVFSNIFTHTSLPSIVAVIKVILPFSPFVFTPASDQCSHKFLHSVKYSQFSYPL